MGGPEAGRDIAGQLLLPAPLHLRFNRHRLERLDTVDRLDQEGLIFSTTVELVFEALSQDRRYPGRKDDVERESPSNHTCQHRAVVVQHHEEHQGEEQVDHQGER